MHRSQRFCHFFKYMLEVVFCEGVRHRRRFCLDHLICAKMADFQFYLQLGKQRKVGWVGKTVFGQNIPCWKMNCQAERHRDVPSSSRVDKVRGEVFTHFHAVDVKSHSSIRNWLFGQAVRILFQQSPWHKRKSWACSWLCSSPISFLGLGKFQLFFPERMSNDCSGLRRNCFEICT
jgi:hypothetical protein